MTDPVYGFFSVDYSQSEKQITEIWVANTLTGLLSLLGGYSTVLTGFFSLLLGNY